MPRSDLRHIHHSAKQPEAAEQDSAWFEDDSEWEYEYDENDTEDFYFTVDLTTHAPDALAKQEANQEARNNGKKARGNLEARLRAGNQDAIEVREHAVREASTANGMATPADPAPDSVEKDRPSNFIQFTGLNTAKPGIVFNGEYFNAYWLTQLGTEMWLSATGVAESAIYRGDVLDVLGTSRARLMALPAKIEPKEDHDNSSQPPASDPLEDDNETMLSSAAATIGSEIPAHVQHDPQLRAQVKFMQRLQELKRKRGETDSIPLYSVKKYEPPPLEEQVKIRAKAMDNLDRENAAKNRAEHESKLVHEVGVHRAKTKKPGMGYHARPAYNKRAPRSTGEGEDEAEMLEDDIAEDDEPAESAGPAESAEPKAKKGSVPRHLKRAAMGL